MGCGNVLVAATEHHERAFFMSLPRELGGQPGLADARLAGQEHGGGAIHLRALPRLGQAKPLGFACCERQLPELAPQRRGKRRRGTEDRGPGHFERDDGIGKPLQLDLADEHEAELGAAAGQTAHEIVAEDLAAVRRIAQSGCSHDRRAMTVAVFPRHVTRADSDAHLDTTIVATLPIRPVDRSLDLVRRVHGLGGGAERRQDPVAEPLHHRPAVLGDRGSEDLVVAPAHEISLDVAEACAHLRAPDDVRIQNRRGPRTVEHRQEATRSSGRPPRPACVRRGQSTIRRSRSRVSRFCSSEPMRVSCRWVTPLAA